MSLVNFGNFAVEWERVYLISITHSSFDLSSPDALDVFADVSGHNPGKPIGGVKGSLADKTWDRVDEDARFTIFKSSSALPIAIDVSRLRAVTISPDESAAAVWFEFAYGRSASLPVSAALARSILTSISPPAIGSPN